MTSSTDRNFKHCKYSILTRKRVFNGYFCIDEYKINVILPDHNEQQNLTRFVFERGDAAAVLLVDYAQETVALVRQFRMPPVCRDDPGWILEIVAGSMTPDESPDDVAGKEAFEEAGVSVKNLESKGMFYLSPGGSSERCYLFFGTVDSTELSGVVGCEPGSDERTYVELIEFSAIPELLASGDVIDAKTVIALQQLLLDLRIKK